MPATMMHLYAAKTLFPDGSDAFYLGSILPDCVDGNRVLKDHLHFRDVPKEERLQSLVKFGGGLHLEKDFDFGVLFHFYLDYLWDNGPQKAHRKMHGEENWFRDYRIELSRAGSRVAQRMEWTKEVWQRLHRPDRALYESSLSLPEEEIRSFLDFNYHWHTEEALPESEIFTDALVDSFIERCIKAFAVFLRDFFPAVYEKKKESLPPLGGI